MGNNTNNKQTQSVKVVINNNISPRRRRPQRRKPPPPPPENLGEMPPPVPPMPQFATGLSPYANRPMTFAPSVQMIQADNGLRVPPYFEKPYTNREASLTEMRKALASELEDVKETLFAHINPQQQAQAQNAVSSLASSVMSAMDMAAPSHPSVVGGVGGNADSSSLSLPDPPHIPQGASEVAGAPPPPPSSSMTTLSSSVGSVGGGSSGGSGGNGSESTVQGGRPPSNSSQGVLPPESSQVGSHLTGNSGVGHIAPPANEGQGSISIPFPMLSSNSLGSSVNQPVPVVGLGGAGSASGGSGYGGVGSVNMSEGHGSVAPPNIGVGEQIYGSVGSGSIGSGVGGYVPPPVQPPVPDPQDVIYGSSGSGSIGSRVGNSQPRQLPEHPYWRAMDMYNYLSSITNERDRKTVVNNIKNVAKELGMDVRGKNLHTIMSMLDGIYTEALAQQQ